MTIRVTRMAALALAAGAVALSAATPVAAERDAGGGVEAAAAAMARPANSYRATRTLTAGTAKPGSEGWMEVETVLEAGRGLRYRILAEGGSERMRERVLRPLLEEEVAASRSGKASGFALSPASYQFAPAGGSTYRVAPVDRGAKRVEGTLHFEPASGYARLEGRLTKSPSFWIRAVALVWHFAQTGSSTVPMRVETIADVKMVGPAWLVMTWHYDEVDGGPVPRRLMTRRASTAGDLAGVFERYVGKRPAAIMDAAEMAATWAAPVAQR
jgi:hypothetical protein